MGPARADPDPAVCGTLGENLGPLGNCGISEVPAPRSLRPIPSAEEYPLSRSGCLPPTSAQALARTCGPIVGQRQPPQRTDGQGVPWKTLAAAYLPVPRVCARTQPR
jgi:hypothetical protein